MNYAFQDNTNLYIVMDLLTGGDLRYHICRYKNFSEEQSSNNIYFLINLLRIFYMLYNSWIGIYPYKWDFT